MAWAALCEARTGPARGPGHSENWRPRRPRPHPIIILCHWPRRRAGSATCRCVQMTVMDPAREGAAISESGQYPERRLPLCCCGSLLRRRPGNGQPPWPQHTRREGRCPSRVDQVAAPPRGRARPQRRAGMAGHGTTTRQSAVARSQEESAALALVRAQLGSGARGGSFVMWPEARTLRVSNSVDGRGIPRFKARRRGRARCVPLGTRAHEPPSLNLQEAKALRAEDRSAQRSRGPVHAADCAPGGFGRSWGPRLQLRVSRRQFCPHL